MAKPRRLVEFYVSEAHPKGEVTQLLDAWSRGDAKALASLMTLVYDELHKLARRHLFRERETHTLQSSALLHEAYLQLVKQEIQWQNRSHFFAVASQVMRRVLVDHARVKKASKRGGGDLRVSLREAPDVVKPTEVDVLALNDALEELALMDPRQCQIIELRYFGGLTIDETAEVLQVSAATVTNEWKIARGWLFRKLSKK